MDTHQRLLIRADADPAIGLGHVSRCRVVADACRKLGFSVAWATRTPEYLTGISDPIHNLADSDMATVLDRLDIGHILIDSYDWKPQDSATLRRLRPHLHLALFDDFGDGMGGADITIALHQLDQEPNRLAGPGYAPLDPAFRSERWHGGDEGVLMCFGVYDAARLSAPAIATLAPRTTAGTALRLILAADAHGAADIDAALSLWPGPVTRLTRQTPAETAALMAGCAMAVLPASTMGLEALCIGTPTLLVAAIDNQRPLGHLLAHWVPVIERVDDLAAAPWPPPPVDATLPIDGYGAERIAHALAPWRRPPAVRLALRPAQWDDAAALFVLANEPTVRAQCFHTEPIPWDDHLQWLDRRLHDDDSLLLLARDEEQQVIGQVRFDREADSLAISICLAPAARGHGLAREMLLMALPMARSRFPNVPIAAKIKVDNHPSLALFARCGFLITDRTCEHGTPCIRMLWRPSLWPREATCPH